MDVSYSGKFLKSASGLSRKLIVQAEVREVLFRANPFHPILRTHKLHGKQSGLWTFSVSPKYRILFIFLKPENVLFLDIGTHDELYQ